MTVTETLRQATGIGYYDIGWSRDTGLLCIEYADKLFFGTPCTAGDVSEFFPDGWIDAQLPPPPRHDGNWDMIARWEADAVADTALIQAEAIAGSADLEPLPPADATVIDDGDPVSAGEDDDPPGDDEPGAA